MLIIIAIRKKKILYLESCKEIKKRGKRGKVREDEEVAQRSALIWIIVFVFVFDSLPRTTHARSWPYILYLPTIALLFCFSVSDILLLFFFLMRICFISVFCKKICFTIV